MTDIPAGSAGGSASDTPGAASTSIEEITAQIRAEYEDRFKGLQRVIGAKDERLSAFETELQQLKAASLTPEELAELQEQEKDRRIADLESQLELRDLSVQFPDEMPHFQRLLAAESAEEQLQALRAYREALTSAAAGTGAPAQDPELDVPEVDPNNPRRPLSTAGMEMDNDIADRILASFGRRSLRDANKG